MEVVALTSKTAILPTSQNSFLSDFDKYNKRCFRHYRDVVRITTAQGKVKKSKVDPTDISLTGYSR